MGKKCRVLSDLETRVWKSLDFGTVDTVFPYIRRVAVRMCEKKDTFTNRKLETGRFP